MITVNSSGEVGKSKDTIAAERMVAAFSQATARGYDEAAEGIAALMLLPVLGDPDVIDVFVTLTGADL